MNNFKVGDVVECLNADNPVTPQFVFDPLEVGKIYKVRGIGNFVGIPGVYLEGVYSLPREPYDPDEQSWREDRFRLVGEN